MILWMRSQWRKHTSHGYWRTWRFFDTNSMSHNQNRWCSTVLVIFYICGNDHSSPLVIIIQFFSPPVGRGYFFRFYVSWPAFLVLPRSSSFRLLPPPSAFLLLPPSSSFLLRRTSTASFKSKCAPSGPNSNLWIKVILDPGRTSIASSRTQCAPPDPNSNLWIKVILARPQLQALERSVPHRTRTATSGSKWSLPDLNRNL